MKIETWDSERSMGYTQLTTAFTDFSVAEYFGIEAIKDTYNRLLDFCKTDYKYLTELEIVTNTKCWIRYENGEHTRSELYAELYYKTRDLFYDLFGNDNEKCNYHFEMTD